MVINNLKKLTFIVNIAILLMVFGLMAFFYVIKAAFLVYFSIPTALIYVIGFFLISKNKLYEYVVMVYFWLTLYMSVTTICLGYDYGFHLYGLSMIPIIFYSTYMGRELNTRHINPIPMSFIIVACYLVATLIPYYRGPVYTSETGASTLFWIVNSLIVFSFLIFYTNLMIKGIVYSEDKLKKLAMEDNLTGLYNRHYMVSQLETASGKSSDYYVAMVDIDDFKKINDIYGHNAGDYILKTIAETMKTICDSSLVSRWGGEEFLVLGYDKDEALDKMEQVRRSISEKEFIFESNKIKTSVTIGIAARDEEESIDKWVQAADDRLYEGKNSGKNKVVYRT
ncbi:diguanylate cyclase (GGDEF) domain-containing protein [Lachnospiraceae bacterium NE2001]|nr:diguanylate cyclase (GGDEF) domain-containing protein [Lachnospiraceae bacterium NE2001]